MLGNKRLFLATPIEYPEYMKIKCKYTPDNIRRRCNLDSKVIADSNICTKMQKGILDLK